VAPAGRPGLVARTTSALRESVWAPVAAKAAAIAAGMVALAAIGAASTLGARGVPVAGAAPVASAAAATSAASGSATFASASVTSAPRPPSGVAPGTAGSAAPLPAERSPAITADGKIVLNQATVEDLVKLPRVGPKRAEAIVELRRRLGRFHQVTDLLRVKGIGRKTLKLMIPKLVVDAT
jgi:competence protein ComEA